MSLTLTASDNSGTFTAYVATPIKPNRAAIIVIQEVFGINAGIRQMCDDWAADGYLTIAPDLFWRQRPNVDLDPAVPAQLELAFSLYQNFDVGKGVVDIQTTIDAARAQLGPDAKVGTVGFCLGGLLSYLAATRTTANANVGYYGVGIQNYLDEASNISAPLLLHIAGNDKFVDSAAQTAIHDGLDHADHVMLYDYEGQEHAFSRINGEHYDEASAATARTRTLEFFGNALLA
jgi:carboxymethylenebutenolidase